MPLSDSTQSQSDSSPNFRAPHSSQRSMTTLCVALALYSFLVGVTLLRGVLSPSLAHFLFVPPPLALAFWYGYGFLLPAQKPSADSTSNASASNASASNDSDYGLLLLCAGWSLIALSLMLPRNDAPAPNLGASAVTAIVCGVLGAVCILAGTILSLHLWSTTVRN